MSEAEVKADQRNGAEHCSLLDNSKMTQTLEKVPLASDQNTQLAQEAPKVTQSRSSCFTECPNSSTDKSMEGASMDEMLSIRLKKATERKARRTQRQPPTRWSMERPDMIKGSNKIFPLNVVVPKVVLTKEQQAAKQQAIIDMFRARPAPPRESPNEPSMSAHSRSGVGSQSVSSKTDTVSTTATITKRAKKAECSVINCNNSGATKVENQEQRDEKSRDHSRETDEKSHNDAGAEKKPGFFRRLRQRVSGAFRVRTQPPEPEGVSLKDYFIDFCRRQS